MKCPKCGGLALRNFDLEIFTNDIWGECVECGAVFIEREQAGITVSKGVKKMTNGDKIRSMTDEELAGILCGGFCEDAVLDCRCEKLGSCKVCICEWLKQEADPIKIGDEVANSGGDTYVVVRVNKGNGTLEVFGVNGVDLGFDPQKFKKTGRHFPQVAELLKAMKGEENG